MKEKIAPTPLTRSGCLLSALLFNSVLNIPPSTRRQEEKKAYILERKEKNWFLIYNVMISVKNPNSQDTRSIHKNNWKLN